MGFTLSTSNYLFSHQECNMQPKCAALSTSGQQSDGWRAIHFSNNIGFTSLLVQEALLPELDELQLTIRIGKRMHNLVLQHREDYLVHCLPVDIFISLDSLSISTRLHFII